MQQISPGLKRLLFLSYFLFLGISSIFGQTVAVNTTKHTTLPQNQIIVNFTPAGGATGLIATGTPAQQIALWTVRIDPDGAGALPALVVPVTSVVAAGLNVIVTFNASGMPTHGAGVVFIKPGETMTVQYAGGAVPGALQVTPGVAFAPAFAARASVNDALFNCGLDLLVFKKEIYGTVDQCIPVTMNFTQYCYRMSLRFRNSSNFDLTLIFFTLLWGDGTPAQNPNPYISDVSGLPSPNFIENANFTGGTPDVILTLRPVNVYPSSTTPAPNVCSWDFSLTPYISGACGSLAQTDLFANYDTDNANTGALAMPFNPPGVGETTDRVCLGTNVNMRFTDATLLNCRLAAPEATLPNEATRSIRIVYGSTNFGAPGNIPDVRVTVPATLGGGTTIMTSNVAGGGVLLNPGNPAIGIPVGGFAPLSVGSADNNGVVTIPPNVTVATALQYMGRIFTTQTTNQAVNQRFFIRIDYWDVCNPYNNLSPTNPAPVSIQNFVQIITKPAALTTTGLAVCYANPTVNTNFTVGGVVAGVTAIRFYNRNPKGVLPFQLMQTGLSTSFPTASYTAANGAVGAPYRTNLAGGAGAYYSVWATQIVGATNNCESDPVEVAIIVQPDLIAGNTPATPTGTTPVCNGTGIAGGGTTFTYNEASIPPIKNIAATTFSNAAQIDLATEDVWSHSFGAGVSNLPLTTSPPTVNSTVMTYNLAAQPSPSVGGFVRVLLRYQLQTVPIVSPLPAPFTLPTYNISALQCPTANASLAVTVFGRTAGGAVTPDRTICDGQSTGVLTLAGHRGQIVKWQRTLLGVTTDIANTTINLTDTPPGGPGVYTYNAVVQNASGGPCAIVNSTVATITVNAVPPTPSLNLGGGSTGGFTICQDGAQQVVLQSSNVGGAGARFDFLLGAAVVQSGPATTYTINTTAQSGSYTVIVYGTPPTSCPSAPSPPKVVTVNPLPTATVSGGGSVCLGNPAPDIEWLLTGTPPYTLSYTDGTTTFGPFSGLPGPKFIVVGPTTPGNYRLTSLVDNNPCTASAPGLGGTATVTIQVVPPPTVSSFTATAPVCDVGAGTNPPDAILDLLPNSVENYSITYHLVKINGGAVGADFTNTYASTAAGVVTLTPTYALMGTAPDALGYQIIITSIFNTTTLCAGAVPISGPTLIVNPKPATATGAVPATACSVPGTGVALNVNDPDPASTLNLVISWSKTGPAVFTAVVGADGAVSGTHNKTFTPATSATFTYYAFVANTSTGCVSNAGLAVTQTQDLKPTAAVGGVDQSNLCTTSTILAATAADNGGQGTWTTLTAGVTFPGGIHNPASNVIGLPQDPPGGGTRATTVTWTVTSALAVCGPTFDDVVLTTNPLPTAIVITPVLCDDIPGLPLQTANVNLNVYNASVSNAPTVQWFSSPLRTPPFLIAAPITINNGDIYYFTATSAAPASCTNTGQTTFTVNALPAAVDRSFEFCENTVGFGSATGINLTLFEMGAGGVTSGGTAVTRDVEWYEDNGSGGLGALIPAGAAAGQESNYSITVLKTIHAKVIDRTSTVIPKCFDIADVTLKFKQKPIDNPITGSSTICTGSAIQIFQVDPALNAYVNPGVAPTVHAYTWTITPAPAVGSGIELVAGGGTLSNFFFVLMKFDGTYTGNVTFTAQETIDGCPGNVASFVLDVEGASPPLAFVAPKTQVCKGETTSYTVAGASGVYTWTVVGGAISGANSGPDLKTISVNWGSLTFPQPSVSVTQVNAAGCTGAPASINVFLNDFPVMTSSATATVCSGGTPALVFTSSVNPATFAWKVTSITGAITGTSVGSTGSGNLGATFTGAGSLKNTSGAVGSVAFDVTPTVTAPPNCPGVPQSFVLTVNPEPTLVNPQTKTSCSNTPVNYEILLTPLNLPAGTVFNWPAPVMSNASVQGTAGINIPSGAAGTFHITDILVNTSNAPITATYTITPSSTLTGCAGTPRTVVVTVNPEPIVSSTLDATRCSDISIGLTLATAPGSIAANNYNITARVVGVGLTAAGSNAAIPGNGVATNYLANDSYNNVTNAQHFVTYTVVPVSVAGCAGAPKIITLTINPEPVLSNLLDVTVCSDALSGLSLNTNGASVVAATYNVTARSVAAGLVPSATNAFIPGNGVAANYLANDTYTNTGSAPLTVIYQIVPISAATCQGNPPIPVTVTVLPEPVVSPGLNASVCSRTAIGLTLNTNGTSVPAFNYNITTRVIDPGLTAGVTNAVVPATGVGPGYLSADVFTNTGSSALNVTYTVVPKSGGAGCSGDSKVVTITVNPEPVVSNGLDKTICSDIVTGLLLSTNGTSVAAANYNITARSISGGLTPNIANVPVPANGVAANYLANDIFNNVGAGLLTVTYTVVPVSASACLGNPKVITITVNPEPVISAALDATVCSEVPIGLTLNTNGSSVAAASYDITARTISAGLTASGGNATVPVNGVAANYLSGDIFFNLGGVPRTVTYTVVPMSTDGCAGDPRVITLTVSPEPIMSNALDATVCSNIATGLTLNTNGTSVGAATFSITAITVPGGLTPAVSNAVVPATGVVVNYLASDKFTNVGPLPLIVTYSVTPFSASNCPGPPKDIFITINPEPVVSPALNATVCSDVPTGLTLATNGASVAAATYNITARTIGGGLVAAGGNAAVPVNGVAANYLANDVFTNTTSLPADVTYTVVPISAASCFGASKVITIKINPEPVTSTLLNTTVCSHLAIGLTLNTNGTSVAAANYNVTNRSVAPGLVPDGGNVVIPANGVVAGFLSNDKFTNTGAGPLNVTYTVVPVSAAACLGNPQVITIIINPEPVVSTTLDGTVCSDASIALTLATDGVSVAAANYNITTRSISAGLTAAGANVVVPATGVGTSYLSADKFNNLTAAPLTVSYTVVPVSAGGCLGSPKVVVITISPEPVLSGSLNLTLCSDIATGLTLNTNGTSVAAQNYNITALAVAPGLVPALGNAVVPGSGVNLGYLANDRFTNTGAVVLTASYTVVPVSAAGCAGDPVVVVVTVSPEPVVSTTLNAIRCSGVTTGLTLNTNGISVAAANYNITNRTVPGALTAGGANAVVPAAGVVAGYLANDVFTNTGASPLDVTYTVVPVSAINCLGDPKIITITINPEPVVANGLDASICSDAVIALTLNTNGSSVVAATYNITLRTVDPALTAAGTNATVPSNGVLANYLAADKFTNTGATPKNVAYTVVPVSAAGCTGAPKIITIIINPEPVTANGLDAFICSDAPVALTLNTNGTSVAAANYNIVSRTVAVGLVANGANVVVPAAGVAANYLLNDSFTNTTSSSLTVTYVVVPVSGAACLGDPKTITMTIRPEPVIANGLDGTRCSGIATGLTLNTNGSSVAAANYNVTVINVAAGLVAAGANAALASGVAPNYLAGDIFTNTGLVSLNVVYTVVPVSGTGCLGDPKNITFTINPEPVVSATLNAAVCSDVATGLTLNTNGTSVAAASYNITGVVIAPSLTAALGNAVLPANAVAANYLATDKFTNTSNANATVVYTVVAVSAGGCVGAPRAITMTIRPEPVVASGLNKTVCSDIAGGITLNTNGTSVAAATYNITAVTVPGGLTVVSAAAIPAVGVAANYLATDTYTNKGNISLDVLYTVVPVSAASCLGDPLVIKQTVTPEAVLGNLNKIVCSDAAISLTLNTNGTSVAASTYNVTVRTVPVGLTAAGTNAAVPSIGVGALYLFNDQFTNPGNIPLDVQYTVVPVSAIGCLGDPVVVAITINPEPVVSNALNKTVCSDVASGITLNTNGTSVAAASYNILTITVAGGLIPKAGNSVAANGVPAGYIAADVFTNKTNASLTVVYNVWAVSATGCIGDPLDVVLTVDPEPVMDPALATKTICSRTITNITLNTNGSSVAAATYNITLVSQDAGLTGVPTTGPGLLATAILNDNFVNVTTIPLKVVYQIVPVSVGSCLGDPFNISVTINAEPVVNPALDNTVCSRDISGIILSTNGTSVAANSYQLVSVVVPGTITADPANALPGSASGINLIKNDKYSNTTSAAVVVTYSVFGISPQSCQGQPQTILLTVNPEPILTPGTANLCSDVPSGIILAPAAGSAPITQYLLKSVAKAPALIAAPGNVIPNTYATNNFLAADQFTNTTSGPLQVTYTIAPIAAGCTGTDQTVVFTVNPAPGIASNLNKTVCTNDVSGIVFSTETSPLSTLAATYNITAVSLPGLTQTAGNTGARAGVTANEVQNDRFQNPSNNPLTVTYTVQGISGSLCVGPTKDIVLTVEPTITAAPVNNKPNICSNDVTNIDLISPTIPTSGGITFNYTAVSSVGGLISGFVPAASNLAANSKITDNLINNSPNPATVTYTITPVANGARGGSGCTGTPVPVVVIVEPKPKLVATPLISALCEGAPTAIALSTLTVPTAGVVHFNVMSTVVTGGMTLTSAAPPAFYLNGQSITDVWSNPTTTVQTVTYTLLPVVSGGLGCVGDNVTITANINPLPTLTNSAQAPICSNEFINIALTSDVANTINTWTASVIVGAVTGSGPGAGDLIFQTLRNNGNAPATVRYTVTPKANGCFGTPLIIDVVVNPLAQAASVPASQKVCFGGTLNVPLTSSVAGVTTFDWIVDPFPNSMGVPQTGSGNVINQVLSNPTGAQDFLTYTITATGPGGCAGQPVVMNVIAAPEMNAAFLNPDTWLCKGSKDFLQIQLDGQAPFELVYTDGTSNFTLTNVGNFKSIQIQPTATTTYSLVSMKDKSQNLVQCSFAPVSQVTFTVGETDANFTVVGPASSCSPYQVTLQYNQKAGTEYTWRWGDGVPDSVYIAAADAAGVTVKHTYVNTSPTGTLKPKIVLQTALPAPFPGCFKSVTQTVNVFPIIITNVFPDKTEICSGELVRFTNQSFGVSATGNRWFYRVQGNVGQELEVITTKNVSYTLTNTTSANPIIYDVVYQSTNGNCPAPDVITSITVYRAITAGFDEGTVPPLIGGHSLVTFTNTSVPIDPAAFRYDWDFGLDATPATANGVGPFPVDFTSPGPRDIVITATNIAAETAGLSCASQFTKTVNIPLLPLIAAFKAVPAASCYPSQITVTENTSTGDVMEWRLIDNNGKLSGTSNGDLPVFQVSAPGKYNLSLKTSSSLTGQVAVAPVQTFQIYDKPLASFDVRPDVVYVPDTELATFNFSFGATEYFWDFGDNGTSTEFQPVYTYKIEGKYDITLIAINDHGDGAICTDTLVRPIIAKQGGLTKVPNAFTPNPNGPNGGVPSNGSFNDVFLPIVKGVEEFNMQIYDRWGNMVFESNNASIGWDGYNVTGQLMPAGVYVYKLTVRLSDNQRSTQIGDVTMIR